MRNNSMMKSPSFMDFGDEIFPVRFNEVLKDLGFTSKTFPPHDILKLDDTHLQIRLAVAGFDQDSLDVYEKNNLVVISGTKQEENHQFFEKGIAMRSFQKKFPLGQNMEVKSVNLRNGLLEINIQIKQQTEEQVNRYKINTE